MWEKEDYLLNFLILFQRLIAKNVKLTHLGLENVKTLCAVDVAYDKEEGYAVAVKQEGDKIEYKITKGKVTFPYIPGFLFMREAPIMIKAIEGYQCDLLLVDGHGLAHPRKSGIATVIGVLLDIPTMGIAKSKLAGDIVEENGIFYVVINGEKVGVKAGKYFYSPGNRTDLQDVIEMSKRGYPEILKIADKLSKQAKKDKNMSSDYKIW
ncbi:endonuclease V [Acidianus ambivalens]|uniref:Endonuclease V n=1 Tax=Acidianus ambivalens TaxID=2283 RepID=A0A650CVN6_ACIAM|nr:endonuclease V [Acidianus ambivalens]MQL55932.1 endonuclease V [Acidianus ambivalens]QGR21507.1 endonuclease V [Acidianus ambivalens]